MVSKLDRSTIVTLCILVLLCLAGVSVPGYRSWKARQQETLKVRCAQALKDKEWDQLETCATAWLDLDKKNGFAWLYLGAAYQAKGDFELAAECLNSLDESDPKCLEALLELVEMQLGKLNRPLEAVATCRRIIKIDPDITKAHQRLTFFYAMTLQRREMIRCIRASIDLNAAEPEAYAYLLMASALRFSNGYRINSHWLKSDPNYEHFQVACAVFLAKGSSRDDASASDDPGAVVDPTLEPLVLECRERFPNNTEILAYLLDFAVEKAYRESLRWDPYDWRSRHQLAAVLRRQNKLDEMQLLTELALEGKKLEQEVQALANAADVSVEMARRISDFANRVGDSQVADGIRNSLEKL